MTISRVRIRPCMFVVYLSAELNYLGNLRSYKTNVPISVYVMNNGI